MIRKHIIITDKTVACHSPITQIVESMPQEQLLIELEISPGNCVELDHQAAIKLIRIQQQRSTNPCPSTT